MLLPLRILRQIILSERLANLSEGIGFQVGKIRGRVEGIVKTEPGPALHQVVIVFGIADILVSSSLSERQVL